MEKNYIFVIKVIVVTYEMKNNFITKEISLKMSFYVVLGLFFILTITFVCGQQVQLSVTFDNYAIQNGGIVIWRQNLRQDVAYASLSYIIVMFIDILLMYYISKMFLVNKI